MKVRLLTQENSGEVSLVEVLNDPTVSEFITTTQAGRGFDDYIVLVNRQAVDPSTHLQDGDVVSLTPKKVTGGN